MAVSQISKFYIFAHLSIQEPLIKELQKLGFLEISEIREKDEFQEWKISHENDENHFLTELTKVKFCIDFLSDYQGKEKKGISSLFIPKKIMNYDYFNELCQKLNYETLYEQCKEYEHELNQIKLQDNKLKTIANELEAWIDLDFDLSKMTQNQYIYFLLGTIKNDERTDLKNTILEKVKESDLFVVKELKNKSRIMIVCLKEKLNEIKQIVQQFHFDIYQYSHTYEGTVKEITREIDNHLKLNEKRRQGIEKELEKIYQKNQSGIHTMYDFLSISRDKEEAKKHLVKSENTFIIQGWIQRKNIPQLKNILQAEFQAYEIYFEEPRKEEQVPVTLDNPKLVKPFEIITELYSLPNYNEIDPTPILSIFYFIFFGFCLSDVGYGATLAILSYFAIHKIKLEGGSKKFFTLLYYCGIAGIFGGIFVGSWFGDILDYLPSIFNNLRIFLIQRLSLFNPTENPIPLLILSLSLGVIHIYTGIVLKFLGNLQKGKLIDGLMDQISWLFLLTGIILVLLNGFNIAILKTIAWVMVVLGALTLVLTQGRTKNNIFLKIGSGILSLYNITGYLGDVLSYSRLFALSLTTGIIAEIFNMFSKMVINIPYIGILLTVIILLIGHIFNLLISVLSAFVHDVRLQYIEFFNKFYQGGGVAFKPFGMKTTYIKLEDNSKN